jgi:hypothetical protein
MIQKMDTRHTRQPLVFAEGPKQSCGKPYPANIFPLQLAAGCCGPAKVPCKLQQPYVAEQLSPASCSGPMSANIRFLQIAAANCGSTFASCKLQQPYVAKHSPPAICSALLFSETHFNLTISVYSF